MLSKGEALVCIEMAGKAWPPLGEGLVKVVSDFPSSGSSEEKVTYKASSLNSAYLQLADHSLVPVNKDLGGPKMEIPSVLDKHWDLVKVAFKKPTRGVIREGKNSMEKSKVGPILSSSLIPSDKFSKGKVSAVVNCCKKRRRQRMADKKAKQFENRQLFRAECKKKTKRGRRKSKGEKAERDAAFRSQEVGETRVSSMKNPKEEVTRGSLEQKSENPKDYDLDAKVIIIENFSFFMMMMVIMITLLLMMIMIMSKTKCCTVALRGSGCLGQFLVQTGPA